MYSFVQSLNKWYFTQQRTYQIKYTNNWKTSLSIDNELLKVNKSVKVQINDTLCKEDGIGLG